MIKHLSYIFSAHDESAEKKYFSTFQRLSYIILSAIFLLNNAYNAISMWAPSPFALLKSNETIKKNLRGF